MRVRAALPGRLEVDLDVDGITAVVGPNGAGKSSLLGAISGSLPAEVALGDRDWSGRPPQARSVGVVHQDHRLFPHLTARENVAFGLRARGTRRRDAVDQADTWLQRLDLGALGDRRPHQLSGGQAQRVAIARALASAPDVLLLDEPFAALDIATAVELRAVVREHLRRFGGPVLLATHDLLDVELADTVLVLEDGKVRQHGPLHEIANEPATRHAAQLLGVNSVHGTAADDGTIVADQLTLLAATDVTGPVLATFAPNAVTLTADRPAGSARNAWEMDVVGLADLGAAVRVHLCTSYGWDVRADITPTAVEQLGLVRGRAVWASVKATEISVFSTARAGSDAAHAR